jgi:hypothetical protein
MMLPTHALGGMAIGLAVGAVAPEFVGVAVVAGFLGGIVPDLDLYAGHRKTLHYPVYYAVLAAPAAGLVFLFPAATTVGAAVFLLGAAVHSAGDVLGGGLELRPWEATSEHAVYDHHRERWIAPRRWIPYDGSPADLLLSVVLAVPLGTALDGGLRALVVVSLAVAVAYAAVRRLLPAVADLLVGEVLGPRLPEWAVARVPARYRRESRG